MTTPSDPNDYYGSGNHGDGQQPLTPPPVQQNQQFPQNQWGQQAPQDSAAWGQPQAAQQAPQQQVPQWGQGTVQAPPAPYPQPGYYPTAQAQPKRRNKALIVRLSIFGVVALIALISFLVKHFDAANVDANGNVTKAGSLSVFSLQKGQCFNEPDTGTAVSSIKAIPCDQAHDAQVTGNVSLTESSYSETTLDDDAGKQCQTVADGVVDQSKLTADGSIIYFVPNQDDWNGGDHNATCAVDEGGSKITGTVLK